MVQSDKEIFKDESRNGVRMSDEVSNQINRAKEGVRDVAGRVVDEGQRLASSAREGIRDASSRVAEEGQRLASTAYEHAESAGSEALKRADKAICGVGESMTHIADSIKGHVSDDGRVGHAATVVADGLRTGGEYLAHHGIGDIGRDLTDVIKRHPVHSLFIGVGFGLLLGSALRRR